MNDTIFVELQTTCGSAEEAHKIADALLAVKLIACAKFFPIESKFLWKGDVQQGTEIMLNMLTIADNFEKIKPMIAANHSYETFVLEQIPVTRVSTEAQAWLEESLGV
jgi:periplasmic divalent cation tolerance protein